MIVHGIPLNVRRPHGELSDPPCRDYHCPSKMPLRIGNAVLNKRGGDRSMLQSEKDGTESLRIYHTPRAPTWIPCETDERWSWSVGAWIS